VWAKRGLYEPYKQMLRGKLLCLKANIAYVDRVNGLKSDLGEDGRSNARLVFEQTGRDGLN
jgi:hypothetical protein